MKLETPAPQRVLASKRLNEKRDARMLGSSDERLAPMPNMKEIDMQDLDTLLTPIQASTYLRERHGISLDRETLGNMRCQGRGPMFQRNGRWIRYRPRWLDDYAASRMSAPMVSTREPATTAINSEMATA
jgi:hypothetical protein